MMDGKDGLIGEELIFNAGDLEVVFEVAGHVVMVKAFQMTSGYDSGGEGA